MPAKEIRRRVRRRIIKQGNSSMVVIPPEFLERMHLFPGDDVEMIFDEEFQGFFVHALTPRTFRPRMLGAANV